MLAQRDGGFSIATGSLAGNGGNATSYLSLTEVSMGVSVGTSAIGGKGGSHSGSGISDSAGHGGYTEAMSFAESLDSYAFASSQVFGGAGGWGYGNAKGGNGGWANGGVFGSGNSSFTGYSRAYGGGGGNSAGGQSAGNGGAAVVQADANSTSGDVSLWLIANGGKGGDSYGSGDAGLGGEAFNAGVSALSGTGLSSEIELEFNSGAGGSAYGTGNAANGRDVQANTSFMMAPNSRLYLRQSARAGDGGSAQGSSAMAGEGGDASSNSSADYGGVGQDISLNIRSNGGNGGNHNGATGMAGNGGDAFSNGFIIMGFGSASIDVHSEGGYGGYAPNTGIYGHRGDATARADIMSQQYGYGSSTAEGREALAQSDVSAISGSANSTSRIYIGGTLIGSTNAQASVGSTANTESFASSTGQFRNPTNSIEAFSFLAMNATDASIISQVAGNTNIESGFGVDTMLGTIQAKVLGAGSFGGQFPDDGSAYVAHAGSTSTNLMWQGELYDGQVVFLGLFGSQDLAGGFESWTLSVNAAGSGFSQTWDSFAFNLNDLFDDNFLSLGFQDYANTNNSNVDIQFSWTASEPGGWKGNFVVGFSAIPEPSSWILVMTAITGFGFFRRRSASLRREQSLANQ